MLNISPKVSGFFIASHLKVSYSVAVELADIAFAFGLKISREVYTSPGSAGRKSLNIRYGGLRIRIERHYNYIDIWISENGSISKLLRDVVDMRDPLREIRSVVNDYQRPRRSPWAVVPTNQYKFTQFL
jgi:hypothetical protein